jgi:TRAP-type mannitol/chloroaromatic compound transport system substrate-binding protein
MRIKLPIMAAGLVALALGAMVSPPPAGAETLRLATNWGKSIYIIARTLRWVEEFNKSADAKAANINISYIGGPEVTPAREQLTAVRSGVFDMVQGAAGYYVGVVPEAFALYGSSITPMEARKNGGLALLNEIYNKKANAEVLGWIAAGVGYHVWLKKEPKLKSDGTPDLSGLKIRSSPLYKAWLKSMGATQVVVPAPDLYSALERGIVDGAAWPGLGVIDLGIEKFLRYRIDPGVWQFDNLLWVNRKAWSNLKPDQQAALRNGVAVFEKQAYEFYADMVATERAKTAAAGLKSFKLSPAAAKLFVKRSQDLQWEQVRKKAPESYEKLRKLFPPS